MLRLARGRSLTCATFLLLVLGASASARAEETPLRPLDLNPQLVAGLKPWLERGDLVVLESTPAGGLAQVVLLSRVRAPAATVLDILAHPETFPSLVPVLNRCEPISRNGRESEVAYDIEIPFKNPAGVMRYIDDRPHSVRYYPLSGNIPRGSWRWEAVPLDASSCLLVHTNHAAIRSLSWAVDRFLDAWPTFEQGAVASTMIVFAKAVAARAEELHSGKAAARPRYVPGQQGQLQPILTGPGAVTLAPLAPLLERGPVALVENGERGQLRQITLIQRIAAAPPRVYGLLANPAGYPSFIPSVATVEVRREEAGRVDYTLWMELPLIKLKQHQQMLRTGQRVAIRSVGGDLPSAVSSWEVLAADRPDQSLVLYYLYSDPGEISWFVKKLLAREPYFNPGLNLATSLVQLRALSDRAPAGPPGNGVRP